MGGGGTTERHACTCTPPSLSLSFSLSLCVCVLLRRRSCLGGVAKAQRQRRRHPHLFQHSPSPCALTSLLCTGALSVTLTGPFLCSPVHNAEVVDKTKESMIARHNTCECVFSTSATPFLRTLGQAASPVGDCVSVCVRVSQSVSIFIKGWMQC